MICARCKKELPDGSRFCNHCGAAQEEKRSVKTRGNGQGSVYKRGKRWVAVVTLGYYPDPKTGKTRRKTRSKSFGTKREAVQALAELRQTGPKEKRVTFRQAYDLWLPTHDGKASTIQSYRSAIHWLEPIWFMPFADIGIEDVQACIDDCPRSRRTKDLIRTVVSQVYDFGIPRKIVPDKVNLGRFLRVTGDYGTREALPMSYLDTLKKHIGIVPGADFIVAQCYLGFRPTEMLALKVSDYNAAERAFVGGTKTEAGRNRTVTVSPKIMPIIEQHLAGKSPADYVFSDENGRRMSDAAYREIFYAALEACGLPNAVTVTAGATAHQYSPHSCRHTFATMLKGIAGADKDKLELIGHANPEMLRYYQEVSYADLRAITDAL